MNGLLWGVSRATSDSNIGQGITYSWAAVARNTCGVTQQVAPEHDVAVCNGQMVEGVNDSGKQTVLAAYPKQPFDWAGRTGTVEFDLSNNTQGVHAAWPAFAITDQPVPAPYDGTNGLPGMGDSARNSIGVSFAQACNPYPYTCGMVNNPTCVGVDMMYETVNYVGSNLNFNNDGCVKVSSGPGNNNHVEIQVNSGSVKVYMSDAGNPASLRLVADASFQVPLSRGLIWMEDVHYNANKFDTQQTNTFSWSNVAFDGPVLARDLAYDVMDNMAPLGSAENGLPTYNLGWLIPSSGKTFTINNVTGSAQATAGLITLNYFPYNPQTIYYSLNGGPTHSMPWTLANSNNTSGGTYMSQTIALPLAASELRDGTNTITLATSDNNGLPTANIDLILVGAGGIH